MIGSVKPGSVLDCQVLYGKAENAISAKHTGVAGTLTFRDDWTDIELKAFERIKGLK